MSKAFIGGLLTGLGKGGEQVAKSVIEREAEEAAALRQENLLRLQQEFTSGENKLQREHTATLQEKSQVFQSSERVAGQDYRVNVEMPAQTEQAVKQAEGLLPVQTKLAQTQADIDLGKQKQIKEIEHKYDIAKERVMQQGRMELQSLENAGAAATAAVTASGKATGPVKTEDLKLALADFDQTARGTFTQILTEKGEFADPKADVAELRAKVLAVDPDAVAIYDGNRLAIEQNMQAGVGAIAASKSADQTRIISDLKKLDPKMDNIRLQNLQNTSAQDAKTRAAAMTPDARKRYIEMLKMVNPAAAEGL